MADLLSDEAQDTETAGVQPGGQEQASEKQSTQTESSKSQQPQQQQGQQNTQTTQQDVQSSQEPQQQPKQQGQQQSDDGSSQASQGTDLWSQIKGSISEELANDPSLQTITNAEDLVKSYIHAQKSIGKNKVSIPDKHGTEDDWRSTMQQLGAPESKDGYEINLGENAQINDEYLDKMKEAAAETGVLPWQLERIASKISEFNTETLQNAEQNQKAQYEQELNELKREWGETYDSKVKKARAAFKELVDEDTRNRLIDEGFGNNPKVVKMLAKAADYLSEDQLVGNGAVEFSSLAPKEALQQAQEIQKDMNHPYHNPSHPKHQDAKKEVQRLYQIAFPE